VPRILACELHLKIVFMSQGSDGDRGSQLRLNLTTNYAILYIILELFEQIPQSSDSGPITSTTKHQTRIVTFGTSQGPSNSPSPWSVYRSERKGWGSEGIAAIIATTIVDISEPVGDTLMIASRNSLLQLCSIYPIHEHIFQP
jgi:hypothetical protein